MTTKISALPATQTIGWVGEGIISSPAAGSIQHGAADVDTTATMVAQTIRTQGALTGGTTNQAGVNLTLIVSPGKGTGAGGSLIIQTVPAGSSGSTPNTPVTALTVSPTAVTSALAWTVPDENAGAPTMKFAGANTGFYRDSGGGRIRVLVGGTFSLDISSSTISFQTASGGIVLKQGANGRVGTFVANGATPVTVNNTSIAVTDIISISLNTVGGAGPIAQPVVLTITAATGFTVAAAATDTSTYNYSLTKSAA